MKALRYALLCSALTLCAPAAAQLSPRTSASAGTETGLFIAPIGGLGLNAERAGRFGPGLRLAPEEGTFVGYQFGNWTLGSGIAQRAETELGPSHSLGFGASYSRQLTTKQRISVDGGLSLAQDLESEPSSLRELYPARGSEQGAGLRLSWRYSFSPNRFVSTSFGYGHRLQDNLTGEGETETSIGTVFGYRFD